MTATPRVTVVIPTYNRAALLVEAIESVLHQSFADLEVVVCDDGSTDDTAARVRSFGEQVRYLALPHTGRPGAPRNRGIAAARGQLIAFLDDDDLWEAEKLARQVELIDRGDVSLVYTDRRLLFSDGSRSEPVVSPAPAGPDRLTDLLVQGQFPSVCTVLMHRSLLEQVSGFDETLVSGEDFDLWMRVARIARAARVPEPLVLVRRRAGTLSDRSGSLAFRIPIRILERSLATGELTRSQRQLCHATLARLNTRLATLLTGRGQAATAVRASLRALRYAPASPAAWMALAKAGPFSVMTGRTADAGQRRS